MLVQDAQVELVRPPITNRTAAEDGVLGDAVLPRTMHHRALAGAGPTMSVHCCFSVAGFVEPSARLSGPLIAWGRAACAGDMGDKKPGQVLARAILPRFPTWSHGTGRAG
jgi:hypothetical protein